MKRTFVLSTVAAALLVPTLAAPALAGWGWDDDDDNRGSRMLSSMDTNQDGKLTQDEFLNRRLDVFKRMDSNGDAKLSKDEFAAGRGQPGTAAPATMQAMRQAMIDRSFRAADADADGTISQEEYTAMPAMGFAMMDSNQDGVVTADEMRNGKSRFGHGMTGADGMFGGKSGRKSGGMFGGCN